MLFSLRRTGATTALAVLCAVGLAACDSGSAPAPPGESAVDRVASQMAEGQPTTDPTAVEVRDENSIDIGDVEQALNLVGKVSPISQADNIRESVIQDRRDRIRTVTVEVSPPNPESLWIGIRVDSTREFVERPVVLDTKVLVDGEVADSFTLILWKEANRNSFQRDVDVLFGRDEIPETMLITMESEALLLPKGTDPTVMDPYSITEGQRTTAISHAPIRIDFKAPGPKARAEQPAAEPETPSEPS